MHIAIDAEPLRPPLTGIGRYTLELARALEAAPGISRLSPLAALHLADDLDHAWALLNSAGPPPRFRGLRLVAGAARRIRRALLGPIIRFSGAEIFHGPNYALPRLRIPGVVTVHDLSHIYYPEMHPAHRICHLHRALPRALERAAAVITVSEAVRREVIAEFRLPPDRVHAVPNGVSPAFVPGAPDPARLARYGVMPGRYILTVGTLEPRKNLPNLLAAHARLPVALRRRFPLAVAGAKGWRDTFLRRELARAVERGDARQLGFVPEEDLPQLYAGAGAVAYPSRYEGFGLPVLEAMACGAPTLTSNRGALMEVAGEAALVADPDNPASLADGLERLLTDSGLRARLRQAGPHRARSFTWSATAAGTVDVYAAVLGFGT